MVLSAGSRRGCYRAGCPLGRACNVMGRYAYRIGLVSIGSLEVEGIRYLLAEKFVASLVSSSDPASRQ